MTTLSEKIQQAINKTIRPILIPDYNDHLQNQREEDALTKLEIEILRTLIDHKDEE